MHSLIDSKIDKVEQKRRQDWWAENVNQFKTNVKLRQIGFKYFLDACYYSIVKLCVKTPTFIYRYDDEMKYEMALNASERMFERIMRRDEYFPKYLSYFANLESRYQLYNIRKIEDERNKKECDFDMLVNITYENDYIGEMI